MTTKQASTNKDIYDRTFVNSLNISLSDLGEGLTYNSIPAWDSVGHMSLIANLESEFDIMIETDDIIDFNSYVKGKEILSKYGISLS